MSANEIKVAGKALDIKNIGEVLDGWRSLPEMLMESLGSADMAYSSTQEILNAQNEAVMKVMEDPNTSDERFAEACQQAREVRDASQVLSANRMDDCLKIITMFLSIIVIAIGGSQAIRR